MQISVEGFYLRVLRFGSCTLFNGATLANGNLVSIAVCRQAPFLEWGPLHPAAYKSSLPLQTLPLPGNKIITQAPSHVINFFERPRMRKKAVYPVSDISGPAAQ